MATHRFTLSENTYEWIIDGFANKVLRSLREFHVKLGIDEALKLISYEDSLKKILSSKELDLENSTLLRIIEEDEKIQINSRVKEELMAINEIKMYTG